MTWLWNSLRGQWFLSFHIKCLFIVPILQFNHVSDIREGNFRKLKAVFTHFTWHLLEHSRLTIHLASSFVLFRLKMRLLSAFVGLAALAVISVSSNEDKKDIGTVIGIDLGTTYSWWVLLQLFFGNLILTFHLFLVPSFYHINELQCWSVQERSSWNYCQRSG